MTVKTAQFVLKPYDAVQVTAENIKDVAKWCQGDVRTSKDETGEEKYVKVRVYQPLNDRRTKAFVGDWVLYSGTGFKVYTPKAFAKRFVSVESTHEQTPAELLLEQIYMT